MNIITGKVEDIFRANRGWFIGHFKDNESPFHTEDFEVKWSQIKKGTRNEGGASSNKTAKTFTLLIKGKFKVLFPETNEEFILENEGDYIFHGERVLHDWEVLEDSTLITFRWPSIPGDQS